jgi:hypothetical protein
MNNNPNMENYELTQDQKLKAKNWLDLKWSPTGFRCEVCQANSWDIGPMAVEIRPFTKGAIIINGMVYPMLMVLCTNCYNTKFFNATIMGLFDSEVTNDQT